MIRRLDAAFLGLLQGLVDLTGLRPAALARLCALGLAAIAVARWALGSVPPWDPVVGLLLCGLLALFTRVEAFFAALGAAWYVRVFFAAWLLLVDMLLVALASIEPSPSRALGTLSTVLLLSYYGFAACRPPRPRPPRRAASLAGGGA